MDNTGMKPIQWFPGHMARTRKLIKENLSLVDAVAEILDARTPFSSGNPEISRLTTGKPRVVILNKADIADESATDKWINYYRKSGITAIAADCKTGRGLKNFLPVLRNTVLKDLIEKRKKNGMSGADIRIMVVGIPNVGKSSFINRMAGSKKAKVEDRPGVTRAKQWVRISESAELLDMPGVLWPKFEDSNVALRLAFTGAIKDDILDTEALSFRLLDFLSENYRSDLVSRYKTEIGPDDSGITLLEKIAKKRGMVMTGGEIDTERAAVMVLDEFRGGKIGRITLELPPSGEGYE